MANIIAAANLIICVFSMIQDSWMIQQGFYIIDIILNGFDLIDDYGD